MSLPIFRIFFKSKLTFAVNVTLISTVIYFPAKKRMVSIKLEPTHGVLFSGSV